MRTGHLRVLAPVCPACRRGDIVLRDTFVGDADAVREGLLECTDPDCQHLYPIVDGIPLLVADLRSLVGDQILGLMVRDDLSAPMRGILGECTGAGSAYDTTRQHLSSYGHGHYGDLDTSVQNAESAASEPPAGLVGLVDAALAELGPLDPPGPVIDVGCSVGRGTFELARRTESLDVPPLVLGVDLNVAMLRIAAGVLRDGVARYPLRRVGLVYDEREVAVSIPGRERVDFWCADAANLPFRAGTAGCLVSLNLVDVVQRPHGHLVALRDLAAPGAGIVLSTPFDWSPAATPAEAWLGGHSPYDERKGRSDHVLRDILTGRHPNAVDGLDLHAEREDLRWEVRLHDRATMRYLVHLAVLLRRED